MLKPFFSVCALVSVFTLVGCATTDAPLSSNSNSSGITKKQSINLFERPWVATQINGKDINLENLSANRPGLQLDEKTKRFTGADGCNGIQGGFVTQGASLRFENIASTLMACHGPQGEISNQFTEALDNTVQYQVNGHELSLLDRSGKVLVKFVTVIQPLP